MGKLGECSSPLCVDLTKAAASHAQVMGVLAGFAVAAIAVVLARSADNDPLKRQVAQRHDGIRALFVALLALIVAAFVYGVAAGEERSAVRVAAMTFAAGIVAVVAVSNLAYGLVGLLVSSAYNDLTPAVGKYVALIVPLTGSVYVFVSAVDMLRADSSHQASHLWIWLAMASLAGLLLIGGVCAASPPARLRRRLPNGRMRAMRFTTEATLIVASFTLATVALAYFLVLLYVPESATALWVIPMMLLAWVVFAAVLFGAVWTMSRDQATAAASPMRMR